MKIDIVTLFPDMFVGPFNESIIKKAVDKDLVEISIHNLRDWGIGKYKQVDDNPFGGGAGMVLMFEPIYNCLNQLKENNTGNVKVIALSAKGTNLKQSKVKELSDEQHLILLAGHYEGFDQRILDELVDDVISIGNYVLTGGELPVMILADSIIRLIPGVLGNENSPISDSFYNDDESRQYPQYTRPAEFTTDEGKSLKVPETLIGGNHKEIENWRNDHTGGSSTSFSGKTLD